ncbi:hypothetical protein MKX03_000224 [Papaver bracteatum]|nr:hypothetical protein MKX03_000224 [Papaver bracteatum]
MSLTSAVPEPLIGRNKDLIQDLCDPFTAGTDDFGMQLLNSPRQSDGGEDDAEVELSHSSLTDYRPEEYEELTVIESKDSELSFGGYNNSFIPPLQEGYRGHRCEGDRCRKDDLKPEFLSERKSSYCEYSLIPDDEYSNIPKKEDWIGSWSLKNGKEQKGYHYLNVYGFYNKKTKMGGYGVIVRDPCGKPVVASASIQPVGVSDYYHVLDGVDAGLALVLKHGIYDLELMCNSSIDCYLRQIFQRADGRFPNRCGACRKCLRCAIPVSDKGFDVMFPLLKRIIDKRSKIICKSRTFSVNTVNSSSNKAAILLARQLAKKSRLSGKPKTETITPEEFEDELKMILYEDAYKGSRFYQAQQRWVFKKKKRI